jgi:lysophospholipase L1-like esterase
MTLESRISDGFAAVANEINGIRADVAGLGGGASRPSGMKWWDTRVATREEFGENLDILVVGDSITEGFTASTLEKTYIHRLGRALAERFGMGRGMYYPASPGGANYPNAAHNVWTKVGGTYYIASGLGLGDRAWYTTSAADSIAINKIFASQFKVFFSASYMTGNARVYIDDVLAATVNTNVASQDVIEWTSAVLPPGLHSIRIQNDGATSFITVEGVTVIEEPNHSVVINHASHSGYTAAGWSSPANVGIGWDYSVSKTNADLIGVVLGINDETASQTPAQLAASIEAVVNRVLTAITTVADPSVFVVIEWANGTDVAGTWDPYVDAIKTMVASHDWGLVDIDALVGYTTTDPYDLIQTDLVHPNDAGMRLWADAIAKYLINETPVTVDPVGGTITRVKAADQQVAVTSFTDDIHLQFPVVAGGRYLIEGVLWAQASPATTGPRVSINGSVAASLLRFNAFGQITQGANGAASSFFGGQAITAYDANTLVGASMPGNNVPTPIFLDGFLVVGAASGLIALRLASEVASAISYLQGSWMRLTRVG